MLTFRELEQIKQELIETRRLIESHGMSDKWMDMKEATEYSSLSASTLRRNMDRGTLKGSRKSGKTLFKRSFLDQFLLK